MIDQELKVRFDDGTELLVPSGLRCTAITRRGKGARCKNEVLGAGQWWTPSNELVELGSVTGIANTGWVRPATGRPDALELVRDQLCTVHREHTPSRTVFVEWSAIPGGSTT